MMFRNSGAAVLTIALAAAACGPGNETGEMPEDAQSDMPGMPGMGAMEGMEGMDVGQGGGMMGEMVTHMEMMAGMSGDSVMPMLQTHRQMVANMIAQMNREMAAMDMPGDTAWNATIDSLRADLTRMPELTADELSQLMPGHRARVMRLMDMHEKMMEGMES